MSKSKSKTEIWKGFCDYLREKVSAQSYVTWFGGLGLLEWDEACLRLEAPNRYVKQWLETHYATELLDAARFIQGSIGRVELLVSQAKRQVAAAPVERLGQIMEQAVAGGLPAVMRLGESVASRAYHTGPDLHSLVVRPFNRLAHTACKTILESPAVLYNPLLIQGDHGLGKTHMLQGLARAYQERFPGHRVRYVSCEEFANSYINAVRAQKLDEFRTDVRRLHLLLIDDIQFLEGKSKTEMEFLHTFDALRNLGRQIVLTSTQHPRELTRMSEGLKARLQAGLLVRLSSPCFETRIELIRTKAKERGLELSLSVVELLAHRVERSIRELEGAVCKLAALSAAEAMVPDNDLALKTLRELGYLREGPLSMDEILEAVAQQYQLRPDDIRSSQRNAQLVWARQVGMYLCKTLTKKSLAEIGRFYGNRDHATVVHAVKKIDCRYQEAPETREQLGLLRRRLGR